MGIKGIYGEIGPGDRIALSKLAIEHFEQTGRPLRIAIDVSIWQFQIQAGRGGSNPAHRTFYYRLLRLLSASVQPLFIFDGPKKPKIKRGKHSGGHGASLSNFMCKKILNLFGFPMHTAPGEAEAECALLQRHGIVDAVLSEDVDTLMFGCGVTLRNWSAEGRAKSPTHVNLYDAKKTKDGCSGLDREGMILAAMMSGGDYIQEGIPGVGVKLACEAARAGFGRSLCQISRLDSEALNNWRENLTHELNTNENKFFKRRHPALKIPSTFPDPEALGYYTHPIVSNADKIRRMKEEIYWDGEIDIPGLRAFVADAFDWTNKPGANKFIRGLAPVLLVHKLRVQGNRRESGYGDILLTQMNEMALVRAICKKRTHISTDGIPELQVIFHPNDIVGLDLDAEAEVEVEEDYGRDGLAPVNDDDEIEVYISDDKSASPSKRATPAYDPTQPEKLWISETIAKIGIPLKVEDYEESLRNPSKFLKAKHAATKSAAPKEKDVKKTKGGMQKGAMDKFVKTTKVGMQESPLELPISARKTRIASREPSLPPTFLAPMLDRSTTGPASAFDSYTDADLKKKVEAFGFKPVKRRAQMIALLEKCEGSDQAASSSPQSRKEWRSSPVLRDDTPTKISRVSNDSSEVGPKRKVETKPRSKPKSKMMTERQKANTNPWTLAQTRPSEKNPTITKRITTTASKAESPEPDFNQLPVGGSSPLSDPFVSSPARRITPPRKHTRSPDPVSDDEAHDPSTPSHANTTLPITPISNTKDICKPSPHKKLSPDTSPRTSLLQTPDHVNRTIDFLSETCQRSLTPDLPTLEELCSPPKLAPLQSKAETRTPPRLSPPRSQEETEVIDLMSSPEIPEEVRINTSPRRRPLKKVEKLEEKAVKKEEKRFVMPRESLPGMWKEVTGAQAAKSRGRAFRISEIEVVDMTEGP